MGSYSGSQYKHEEILGTVTHEVDAWGGDGTNAPVFGEAWGGGVGLSQSYFSPAGSVWLPPQVHRNAPC